MAQPDRFYGNVIWTNHALTRLNERKIPQQHAWYTLRHPDQTRRGSAPGSWVYYKTYDTMKIEVVAKENERKEWIILSVWSRPVYGAKAKSKPSILSRIFHTIFG